VSAHAHAQAYIHHIRRAERFIYIENQYFLGSCYMWPEDRNVNCSHTVPAELAAKICGKIRKREQFHAYIVIPLFPEGDPDADSVQAVLRFQVCAALPAFPNPTGISRTALSVHAIGGCRTCCGYQGWICCLDDRRLLCLSTVNVKAWRDNRRS
jgi:hypothetical protein